jgi:hypothetical protein
VEIASFNAASLDAGMTRRVFEQHGVQAACSLGLTLDADISSDSAEVSQPYVNLMSTSKQPLNNLCVHEKASRAAITCTLQE